MDIASPRSKVDVAPFAVRQERTTNKDFEIWWEDPRDLFQIDVRFAPGTIPQAREIHLEYWQQSWPEVHVPKGAVVGSGREGWLALDDWTNGNWQRADYEVELKGDHWSAMFRPLSLLEYPELQDFPVEFRRTLKVRLRFDRPGVKIDKIEAFTDSEWRETDLAIEWKSVSGNPVTWDGHLEVFNGELLSIQPLASSVEMADSASWRSMVEGPVTAGVRANVRYGYNEDANSFDRTIVTVRSEEHSFSFLVDDVLAGEPVYVRDLGVIVSRADAGVRLAAFEADWEKGHEKTLYQCVQELSEQTWGQAWADMPAKHRFYFVLGCEGGRQKFGVEPNGDVFLGENFIRRVPGKDTARLGWEGKELRYGFGFPEVEAGDRSIVDGYLPVIRTTWTDGGLCYEQEAYATWLWGDILTDRMAGDDPVVAMVRVRVTNLGEKPDTASLFLTATVDQEASEQLVAKEDLVFAERDTSDRLRYLLDTNGAGTLASREEGLAYDLLLPGQGSHMLFLKIPFIELTEADELSRLRSFSYEEERERVVAFWQRRIAEGAQIETPNETLNNFYRTHLMHMLVVNDREPGSDRNVARCGGFHYGSFPDEGCMVISDLDRRGYTKEAERCLDLYVHYQGTAPLPGNFRREDGVFYGSGGYEVAGYNRNQGWVLWCLAEHYRYTRDRAWLERVAPALIKGCDWVALERQATMRLKKDGSRPIDYGFLPTGSLEDVTDYWTWLSVNAYAYLGFSSAAEVLMEIGHPEATRLQKGAEAYGQDLREGFFEACIRSPVVRLRDSTWVPHFPPRQQRRGRDFGWLREVLEGAAHLVYCGLIAPDEPAAHWIVEDYEDNLFLSDQYGYSTVDFEQQWFSWGGFSMQPNLLIFPLLYLARDEPKHYLRSYFNPFAATFYPDTMMLTEHPLPTLSDWLGDHFKSSDEALSTFWLRLMLLAEYGDELFVGQAIPRAWFEDGRTMRVERALTHFGEVSLAIASHAATGTIVVELDPPRRSPPHRIKLRVRHPEGKSIRSVWMNGKPHSAYDVEREVIFLENWVEPVEVRVKY
jgi:hypothetical protein